ncbi:MAG: hypothetical protein IPJ03_11850 [Ignavibacteriales bacterium]|nr:hypothetical protein [Ignavibacteriales bacterium]
MKKKDGIILALIPIGIGFLIHSILPIQYKLPFFLLLSLITYGIVIGALNAFFNFPSWFPVYTYRKLTIKLLA